MFSILVFILRTVRRKPLKDFKKSDMIRFVIEKITDHSVKYRGWVPPEETLVVSR